MISLASILLLPQLFHLSKGLPQLFCVCRWVRTVRIQHSVLYDESAMYPIIFAGEIFFRIPTGHGLLRMHLVECNWNPNVTHQYQDSCRCNVDHNVSNNDKCFMHPEILDLWLGCDCSWYQCLAKHKECIEHTDSASIFTLEVYLFLRPQYVIMKNDR